MSMYLRGLNPRTVIQEVVAEAAIRMEMIKKAPVDGEAHAQETGVQS